MKTCNICHETKELNEFYKEKQSKDGYRSSCKSCKNKSTKGWRVRNKEEWNAYMRKHRAEHPNVGKERRRSYSRLLKNRYGITLVEYEKILIDQNSKCAICAVELNEKERNCAHIDHDHITGIVRGILCPSCNCSISILDNPELLEKAIAYLQKHK